tara:strand:+ start:206 stop:571 length:366 start_codon:yes stop_codon:yes gene_type:complete
MKTIYEFKKGDKIVRVEPAKSIAGGIGDGIRDRSYVGEKMLFHGIANGVIYIKPTQKVTIFISDNGFIDLPLDIWDEGWDYWVEPKNLNENCIPKHIIEEQINKALAEENYELADRLKNNL